MTPLLKGAISWCQTRWISSSHQHSWYLYMISQIHPMLNSSPNTSGSDPARSSSTGSTSSGFSSDIHRLTVVAMMMMMVVMTKLFSACSPRNLQNHPCLQSGASPPTPTWSPTTPAGARSPSSFKTGTKAQEKPKRRPQTLQASTFLAPPLSGRVESMRSWRGWCWTRRRTATQTPVSPAWTPVARTTSSSLTPLSEHSLRSRDILEPI